MFLARSPHGGITHIALVSEVAPDGRYRVVEASRDNAYVTREVAGDDLARRGWVFRGFSDFLRPRP